MDYDYYDTRERGADGVIRKRGFLHVVGLILHFLVGPRWPGFGMVGDYRMMGLCMGI